MKTTEIKEFRKEWSNPNRFTETMKTTELTKVQLADLIDAVSYMKPTDWAKYKEDGNRSGDRIPNEDGKRRQSELLRILYGVKSELEK